VSSLGGRHPGGWHPNESSNIFCGWIYKYTAQYNQSSGKAERVRVVTVICTITMTFLGKKGDTSVSDATKGCPAVGKVTTGLAEWNGSVDLGL